MRLDILTKFLTLLDKYIDKFLNIVTKLYDRFLDILLSNLETSNFFVDKDIFIVFKIIVKKKYRIFLKKEEWTLIDRFKFIGYELILHFIDHLLFFKITYLFSDIIRFTLGAMLRRRNLIFIEMEYPKTTRIYNKFLYYFNMVYGVLSCSFVYSIVIFAKYFDIIFNAFVFYHKQYLIQIIQIIKYIYINYLIKIIQKIEYIFGDPYFVRVLKFILTNILIIVFMFVNIMPSYVKNYEILDSCIPMYKFLILPIIATIHILFINKKNELDLKLWALFWSINILMCLGILNYNLNYFSYTPRGTNTIYPLYSAILFNKKVILYAVDSISLLFLYLTTFLFIIVFLLLFVSPTNELKKVIICLYVLYIFLLNVFTTQNLLFFFFFFESTIYPMFLIILLGGSRFQKFKASYYFVFFTIFGSLPLFISISYLLYKFNNLNILSLLKHINELTIMEQRLIWLSFFCSFAIKIPMFPFHTWLPEAHVEAPTIGSVLLAGILLKLGIYGFIRICFYLFPEANVFFSPYIHALCIIGIFHSCIIAIRQTDLKRIIAYASIAHMNLIVLGLFSFTPLGIYGAIFQSISHGLVSSALFILVGFLYTRYKTRCITYYSGLTQAMPIFSTLFFFFIFANISFPLTSNFIGELLLFTSISKLPAGVLISSAFGIILNTIYSLWFCNRILYGNIKSQFLVMFKDLNKMEIFIVLILVIAVLILGIFPNMVSSLPVNPILDIEHVSEHIIYLHSPYLK